MKKLKLFVFMGILFLSFNMSPLASSVSVKVSNGVITKGDSVTVTATINADSGIYTTEGTVSCSGAGVSKSAGMEFEDLNTASTSKSFSFTIKPTSSGTVTCQTSNVRIRELKAESVYSLDNGSATITVKEPAVINKPTKEYSSNNNLKSLVVDGYDLVPNFSKDTKEYNVEVPNGTEKVNIKAEKEDSSATISGTGEISVTEGVNKLEIKVTAENGNEKVYVINVTVKELDAIEVTVDKKKYTIIRKEDVLEPPSNYEKSTIKIGDQDVLCYKNKITKNILIGLKSEDGTARYYLYDEKTKTYTKYLGYKFGELSLIVLDMPKDKLPSNYIKKTFTYGEDKIDGYVLKNGSNDFYLFYGQNELTGKKNLYVFDKSENTAQRFNDDLSKVYKKKANNYFIGLIVVGTILTAIIITLLVIWIKKKKESPRINHKRKTR